MNLRKFLIVVSVLFAANTCGAACHDDGSVPGDFPFASDEMASSFLAKVQSAASRDERGALAELIHFPLRTTLGGKKVIMSRTSLMLHFSEVFNSKVLAAISSAHFQSIHDYSCVFWNNQGMMLGYGEIWFDSVKDRIKIVTVNNS
jgi:hypothetical protein